MPIFRDRGEEHTAADIASIAAAVNTTAKFRNKVVTDTTNEREMRALGPAAGDDWLPVGGADGIDNITPA